MKTLLVSTIIASLTLVNVPAYAGGFDGSLAGGLIGGIAGGIIAGAIEAQGRPHVYYVVPHRYAPPRPRVIVVRAPPVVVQHTVTETVGVPVAVPVAVPVNGLNGVAPAPAPAPATTVTTPIVINNAPAPAPAAAPVIVVNQAPAQSPAPVAPPTAAVAPSIAILAERCQHDFSKTEDYLACVKGTPIVDQVVAK
jgi:hypothetical protein